LVIKHAAHPDGIKKFERPLHPQGTARSGAFFGRRRAPSRGGDPSPHTPRGGLFRAGVRQIGKLADTKSPQGVVGLFAAPATDLQKLYRPGFRSILVCDGIADPGNLGTLLRSALAFDFDLVILTGRSTEPYSPKVVRSSMGAMFGLRIAVAESDAVAALIADSGCTVLAATVSDGGDEWRGRIKSNGRLVLTIGSEAEGLSPEIEALATVRAHITHSTKVESLNAAVAGSILMKEVYDLTR
jgi:TrmH family RNA methyltransferase